MRKYNNLTKVEGRKSSIHGKGLFVTKDIKAGELICYLKGIHRHFKVRNQKDVFYGKNWIGYAKNEWLQVFPPIIYINHSCEPNSGVVGRTQLRAIKKIPNNSEITIDYSTIEQTDDWYMSCGCGQSCCRKKIGPIQSMPIRIFKKRLPFIPTYFQKVYNTYHEKS